MLQPQLLKFSQYNYWANQKCTGLILAAGVEKADMEQLSSFPTIRKTLYHIWDAEIIWLKRLLGEPIPNWPPSADFSGSLEDGVAAMLLNSKCYIQYLEEIKENQLHEYVNYNNTSNKGFSTMMGDVLMHCFNHSTYHRGQLITMLRFSGYKDVTSTDYITYCRML